MVRATLLLEKIPVNSYKFFYIYCIRNKFAFVKKGSGRRIPKCNIRTLTKAFRCKKFVYCLGNFCFTDNTSTLVPFNKNMNSVLIAYTAGIVSPNPIPSFYKMQLWFGQRDVCGL